MAINIVFLHMPESPSLSDITRNKVLKLIKKYSWVSRAEVLFKHEHDTMGNGKICEIQLSASGPRIFAKSNENDFEKAMASTVKQLERQLKKRKETFQKK